MESFSAMLKEALVSERGGLKIPGKKPEAKEGMIPSQIWGTQEFTEGKVAAIEWGMKPGAAPNPYKSGTSAWRAWNEGWNSYVPGEVPAVPEKVTAKEPWQMR